MPSGPDARVKITEEYAREVGRDAYFWAWPMVNIYNRRLAFSQVKEAAIIGPLIQAPLNQNGMLTDYVAPEERSVACPNQDVVYGIGSVALDVSPVVVQVPDFGNRFWVYQIVDLRTDSFVEQPAAVMRRVDQPDQPAPIWTDFQRLLDSAEGRHINIERVERFAFYERARSAFGIVATGETALYGNLIIKKGIIAPR